MFFISIIILLKAFWLAIVCNYSGLFREESTRHLRAEKGTRHLRLSAWHASRKAPAPSVCEEKEFRAGNSPAPPEKRIFHAGTVSSYDSFGGFRRKRINEKRLLCFAPIIVESILLDHFMIIKFKAKE
jgi:hypothetical protein